MGRGTLGGRHWHRPRAAAGRSAGAGSRTAWRHGGRQRRAQGSRHRASYDARDTPQPPFIRHPGATMTDALFQPDLPDPLPAPTTPFARALDAYLRDLFTE